MPDIIHHFPIIAPAKRVFQAVSTPTGLDAWWTKRSSGGPIEGTQYNLWFGPEYDWRATVSHCVQDKCFELLLTDAMDDWRGTKVEFLLDEKTDMTHVRFRHSGWAKETDHFATSSFCWAMYLRLLKRFVEIGEVVPYENRLDV